MSQVSQSQGLVGVSQGNTTESNRVVDPVYVMAGRLVSLLQRYNGSLRMGSHATYGKVANQLLHDRLLNCKDAGETTVDVRRTIIAAFQKLEHDKTIRRDDHNRRIVLTQAKKRRGRKRSQRYTNSHLRSRPVWV